VLLTIAEETGLDKDQAAAVIADQRYADTVRAMEQQWQAMGVHSVPAVILQEKYLISGAQSPETYIQALTEVIRNNTDETSASAD